MNERRGEWLARAHAVLAEIRQIFLDAEHWNRLHPEEEPIDPDPDDVLARDQVWLEASIARLEEA